MYIRIPNLRYVYLYLLSLSLSLALSPYIYIYICIYGYTCEQVPGVLGHVKGFLCLGASVGVNGMGLSWATDFYCSPLRQPTSSQNH